jgi:formylglycine-generating enzyme required for sulfatase activity/tRNA A-37 threonylcarbamoyl transferase component Bud32
LPSLEARAKPPLGKDGKPAPTGKPAGESGKAKEAAPKPAGAGGQPARPDDAKDGKDGKAAQGAKAGATPAGPVDPLLGKELGGCRIDSLLGRGAMGAVYKASQRKLDRDVAVKVIRPEMMTDARMLKRFEVEARIVGKFNSANVVMVHDVGFELGVHYLVMEFVQGKNLRDHVKLLAAGRLPAGEALPLLRQAIRGLEEAQRLHVVHRDIKPDNLMLTDRGMLKIADFGIAKPMQEDFSMTLTSELVGTPLYMSPEQCQGGVELDFRSDMYSLGATFYYLLTGEPPIRASSVYELIQTKTKLANLCLWKALPGLDENNPLSRVIERMTALDRDDRYDSYEALSNDLLLVEQGATITAPVRKAASRSAAAASGGGRGKLVAGLVAAALLAAGGGGYAWYSSQPKPAGGGGTVAAGGDEVVERVSQQLQLARQQLASAGPSEALQRELGAIAAPPALQNERDRLVADVAAGLAALARLGAIQAPTALELPFAELRTFFADVMTATELPVEVGTEVRAFVQKAAAAARAERELAPRATARLAAAFQQWQADAATGLAEEQGRIELGDRLGAIEAGRRQLLDLLQQQALRSAVEADLPAGALDEARRLLAQPPPVSDLKVAEVLAELASELQRSGPDAALEQRLKEMQPSKPELIARRDELLNEFQRAGAARMLADQARTDDYPAPPKPPFDDVDGYWKRVDRALEGLRKDGGLPPWAATLRTTLRAETELLPLVVEACRTLALRVQAEARAGTATPEAVQFVLQARERAIELFPGARAALEQAVVAADLQATGELVVRGRLRVRWQEDAARVRGLLLAVPSLAEWLPVAAARGADVAALQQAAAALAAEPEVATTLRSLVELHGRWLAAASKLASVDRDIAAGDLTGAAAAVQAGLPGNEGRVELAEAADIVAACRDAFNTLDRTLQVDVVLTRLQGGRDKAQSLRAVMPATIGRIDAWIGSLQALQQATVGMVPIPGGGTRVSPKPVTAFFLSATECSRAEFAAFLAELRAAVAGIDDRQQRWAKVASRFDGIGLNEARLQELLEREITRDLDKTPMDSLDWYGAAAYAAWYRRVLPTAAEWSLAAFGDNKRYEYPWGNDWAMDPQQRNPSNTELADVDAGGLSWRQADGVKLHHLGGNVAEWLAVDAKATQAGQIGGRYKDTNRDLYRGEIVTYPKDDRRPGVGCRTALRLRDFPGLDWPR